MPDIRIEHTDGRVSFGECWINVDSRQAEVSGVLNDPKNSSMALPASNRVWTVRVNGEFGLNKREEWLPRLLAELEAGGKIFEIVTEAENLERDPSTLVQRAWASGIRGLASRPVVGDEQGRVDFGVWGIGGPADISWEPFMEWIREMLFAGDKNMTGIRRKLAESGGDERHALVGVTYSGPWEVLHALSWEVTAMPPGPPELPEEITHLWIIPAMSGDRCLVWTPEEGWLDPTGRWVTD